MKGSDGNNYVGGKRNVGRATANVKESEHEERRLRAR